MINLDFTKPANGAAKTDKTPSQFWLNVGYYTPEGIFVGLGLGIPLDALEPLPTNTRNEEYNQLNVARNALTAQLLGAVKGLNPGEQSPISLQVQARRIEIKKADTPLNSDNPFLKGLPTL